MMESYFVPDRLALNTAFPSSPVAGREETTADNKMTFYEITNFQNVTSIQLSTIHFQQQVGLQIIYSSTGSRPVLVGQMNYFACGRCMMVVMQNV